MTLQTTSFDWLGSPLDLYAKLYPSPFSFFLYSSMTGHSNSRYSYMGCDPYLIFQSKGQAISVFSNEKWRHFSGNPLIEFEKLFNEESIRWKLSEQDFFSRGAVGYWGYDLKDFLETLPSKAEKEFDAPDSFWMFYKSIIVIDHRYSNYFIVGDPHETQKLYDKITNIISPASVTCDYTVSPSVSESDYIRSILSIKERIGAGDVYEVNLSQRFHIQFENDEPWRDFNIFRSLTEVSPAPFSAILKCLDFSVISSSPERFLKIRDRVAESQPIKGTRPCGLGFSEDEQNYLDLYTSDKDHAENLMIVDLVRNDLGRVSKAGSVAVKDLFKIEKFSTVFQMLSTISGTLNDDVSNMDVIRACFPPGSMTGAPKISAMKIIEELEPYKRGIYSGAIGYMGFDGNCDLSVIIRTLILLGQKGYFQTGGAVVWDSDPKKEYEECWDKARGILNALEKLKS
ncbi:aminodeoxychorismate synthase component I [bacterium]|nr:aminodeoxychorismate synthase component I [bacterium]